MAVDQLIPCSRGGPGDDGGRCRENLGGQGEAQGEPVDDEGRLRGSQGVGEQVEHPQWRVGTGGINSPTAGWSKKVKSSTSPRKLVWNI